MSTMDHPKKTKLTSLRVHQSNQELSTQRHESQNQATTSASRDIVITSKQQILSNYSDIFEGIGRFPSLPYHILVNPNITPKQTPC